MSFNESFDAVVDPKTVDEIERELSAMYVVYQGRKNKVHRQS